MHTMKGEKRPENIWQNVSRDFFWDGEEIGDYSFPLFCSFQIIWNELKCS